MTASIIHGTTLSQQIEAQLKAELALWAKTPPILAVVLLGDDPASKLYVSKKQAACERVGIRSVLHQLDNNTQEKDLLALIARLNADPTVHGILLQLPLPDHLSTNTILETINPIKDVDGFHPYNLGRLAQKRPLLRPCTPMGIVRMLDNCHPSLLGLHAVCVGASNIVGRPMSLELLRRDCTVSICHQHTRDIQTITRSADILVVAVGKTHLVNADWVKPGATVIDVGINHTEEGITGDVHFESVEEVAGWISPVPGGVGPMTVVSLLENTLQAYRLQTTSARQSGDPTVQLH